MVKLTNAQVLAAAAPDRLVNVISAPGSGKTTIAAERYGYQRYQGGDLRGVLGLTFNRAAAAELRRRIDVRWGANCIRPAHRVVTFDHLHVDLLTHLLSEGKVMWPNGATTLDVRDDYRGVKGFRFLPAGSYVRYASLDANRAVVSESRKVAKPEAGIGGAADHRAVLRAGTVSHDDVRWILRAAMQVDELQEAAADWLSENYRATIIDEVYDADDLDLYVAYVAAEAGLSVTLIGDPWQALYKWRGAKPEIVERLLGGTSDQFIAYEQPESFRFLGEQMPQLAANLRAGAGATLPRTTSSEVDVALARNWTQLWSVGDNVLPLAFRTVNNATDAAMNLLLDVVTRARLGTASYGREGAIAKLGLDREYFHAKRDEVFAPLVASLLAGKDEAQVLEDLREAVKSLGVRKPSRLSDENEANVRLQLSRLATRLKQPTVIPGLTVFQAKGREWERVGVVLSNAQAATLASGLHALDEEHCIIYVAITRASRYCGRISGPSESEADNLPFT
ncbi:UvrD-helicase domain-containing protein [Tessaracoccus sp. MC1627]|uniref:UvrD-helicase domain-containing protein n=1 Tax=Tessaracoccus sp. MC1627 TaxID=2760312 RepID=UPI0016016065|nr:UvrD-helicase domain-containing protein [Tessaracoccus sp. MC1627]MBB1514321.1 UvrD-helicase domain-containing protein [Tessaracoccus sp. MC1627]